MGNLGNSTRIDEQTYIN